MLGVVAWMSATVIAAILLLPRPPETVLPKQSTALEDRPVPDLRRPLLVDVTADAGALVEHRQAADSLTGMHETLGVGACLLDYDADGRLDLFLLGGSGERRHYGRAAWWQAETRNTLLRNLGGMRFEDVTESAGLASPGWGMGCAAADLDGDGDTDLLLSEYGGLRLLANGGDGVFAEVGAETALPQSRWPTSIAVADYDRNGWLDIYVTGLVDYVQGANKLERASGYLGARSRSFDPQAYDSLPNLLLHNLGGLRFTPVGAEAGVADVGGRGLSASWHDVDDDGFPELFVVNHQGSPNRVWRNRGGTLEAVPDEPLGSHAGGAGIAIADLDNDGNAEVIVGTDETRHPLLYRVTANADRLEFKDVARAFALDRPGGMGTRSWGIMAGDLNLDGFVDLFLANGFLFPDPDAHRKSQGQPNALWLGNGRVFRRCAICTVGADSESSRAPVSGDLDNDGDLDLLVTQNNGLVQLLENRVSGSWLGVVLEGRGPNTDAVGARVVLDTDQGRQTRWRSVGGFLSSADPRLHFGLGTSVPRALTIHWPDGETQRIDRPPKNRYLVVRQGVAYSTSAGLPTGVERSASPSRLRLDLPEQRMTAIEWLRASGRTGLADSELDLLLADVTDSDNAWIAERLAALDPARLIGLTTSDRATVRVAAINALAALELEAGTRWMLRGLDDESPLVRCAAADAFGRFFDEEEAMVASKYLAVPALVRMLDAPVPAVRRCAINALARAERYRGVDPIRAHLIADPCPEVRADAARALGLLRERRAVVDLYARVAEENEATGVRAQALIALARVSTGAFDRALAQLLDQVSSMDAGLAVLETAIGDDEHGVALPVDRIAEGVTKRLETAPVIATDTARAAARLLASLGAAQARSLLMQWTDAVDDSLRAEAYLALIEIDQRDPRSLLDAALSDPSTRVRDAVIARLAQRRVALPGPLLERAIDRRGPTESLVDLIAAQGTQGRLRLQRIVEDPTATPRIKRRALARLAGAGIAATDPSPRWHRMNAEMKIAYFDHYRRAGRRALPKGLRAILRDELRSGSADVQQSAVALLGSRRQLWAKHLLRALLGDASMPLSLRQAAAAELGKGMTVGDTQAVVEQLRSAPDELIPALTDALAQGCASAPARTLLRSFIQDADVPARIRFDVARCIAPSAPADALAPFLSSSGGLKSAAANAPIRPSTE